MVVDVFWQEVPEDGVIPDGTYHAIILQCLEKDGDKGEWFEIFWQIVEGQFKGAEIRDAIFPTKGYAIKARQRAKSVCKRLGMEVEGHCVIAAQDFKGKGAYITTTQERNEYGLSSKVNWMIETEEEYKERMGLLPKAEEAVEVTEESVDTSEIPF